MKKIDIIQLVGIYIILTSLSYAFYIVFVAVGANEEIASSLLSWTSTMFATIALLYTFNSWREQKGSEVIANEAKDLIKDITQNISILGDIIYEYSNLTIKNEKIRKIYLQEYSNEDQGAITPSAVSCHDRYHGYILLSPDSNSTGTTTSATTRTNSYY